jgi:hypothetical protein
MDGLTSERSQGCETEFVYERLEEMEASVTKGELLEYAWGVNIGSKQVAARAADEWINK